jgi:hypothetical protein
MAVLILLAAAVEVVLEMLAVVAALEQELEAITIPLTAVAAADRAPLGLMAISTRKVGVALKIAVLVAVVVAYFPEAVGLAV